jgi:hypothetical protein
MNDEAKLLFEELERFLEGIEDHKSKTVRKHLESDVNIAHIQLAKLKEMFK